LYDSPVSQNCIVPANLCWAGIAARSLLSSYINYGPTILISWWKSTGVICVKFFVPSTKFLAQQIF
jgi:hypothetical protein